MGSLRGTMVAALAVLLASAGVARADGPTAISQDAQGDSYVGFADSGSVAIYDVDGNPVGEWGFPGAGTGQLGGVIALSVDPGGNVWVLDTNLHVQEFTPTGVYEGGFTLPACAAGDAIAPSAYGGLVATSTSVIVGHPCADTLLRYTLGGVLQQSLALPARPRGLAFGPAGDHPGRVFVALPDKHQVLTLDAVTFARSAALAPLPIPGTPAGVADKNDPLGDELFVSDASSDDIYVYDPSHFGGRGGTYTKYRTIGHGPGDGVGMTDDPDAIAIHQYDGSGTDTNVFIADAGNSRIQRWTDAGYVWWMVPAVSPMIGAGALGAGSPVTGATGASGTTGPVGGSVTTGPAGVTGATGPAVARPPKTPRTAAPSALSTPVISGLAAIGGRLICAGATFAGTPAPTTTFAWSRAGAPDGTSAAHTVSPTDVGQPLLCAATAVNSAGQVTVAASAVTPVSSTTGGPVAVTIDGGAPYTRVAAVSLTVVPPAGTTAITISGPGNADAQTYPLRPDGTYAWSLPDRPTGTARRRVYVAFTVPGLAPLAPISDEITFDHTAPAIRSATISQDHRAGGWSLAVRASDPGSGVGQIQYGRSRTGTLVTVPFRHRLHLQSASQARWARVVDRAGNASRWLLVAEV